MKRGKFIDLSGDGIARQERMFGVTGVRANTVQPHPEVERTEAAMREILKTPAALKGIDFEFDKVSRPTIVSICLVDRIACTKWTPELGRAIAENIRDEATQWVAHSGTTADKPVNDASTGIVTSLDKWEDSMITHFLANQHLTKAPSKEGDDDGALGFMNLWCATSLTTDMFNWKFCRGHACVGPCPSHDPLGYCGVDAWGGLVDYIDNTRVLGEMGVPRQLYREIVELTDLCWEMESRGIKINLDYVRQMESTAHLRKDDLFPYEITGTHKLTQERLEQFQRQAEKIGRLQAAKDFGLKPRYTSFNPRSSGEVVLWFKEHGIKLASNSKGDVRKALERELGLAGFNSLKELEESPEELPEALEMLYRLDQYKSEGKGLDAWFGDKYMGKDGFVHPRFVTVGTSTGRLSSARPNFQNVPARGFGDLVRRALIPRDPSLVLLKSDFKQLELRMCLYLSGVDQSIISQDAFYWLVDQAGDLFFRAAEIVDPKGYAKDPRKAARNIAKRISHAGDYLEGFKLLEPYELEDSFTRKLIDRGALKVYAKKFMPELQSDWTFMGRYVAFTGSNLAEALFGDTTYESRRKALDIQENIYFKKFHMIREWHRKVLAGVESTGVVKSPTGRFMRLYGRDEDKAKVAVAYLGQGVSADHVQGVMLRYKRELGVVPLLQVHDELVFERDRTLSDDQNREFISLMAEPTWRLDDFAAPCEAKIGDNWKDMRVFYGE